MVLSRAHVSKSMDVKIEPGVYVVAASGGIDSMSLLDILSRSSKHRKLKLIVAHFDHGIRIDSGEDRLFVQKMANGYGLPFVYDKGYLGTDASEQKARHARYQFLEQVRKTAGAKAIITAHHQDDMLETAIINIVRGTGRRGLTSLKSGNQLIRPLLSKTKEDITNYATSNNIQWREDSTNLDTKYLRNYIRHNLVAKFSAEDKSQLFEHIDKLSELNVKINKELENYLDIHPSANKLDRHWFIMLPHVVAREVMISWLRGQGVTNIDKKQIERLVHGAKTLPPERSLSVDKQFSLIVKTDNLALDSHER